MRALAVWCLLAATACGQDLYVNNLAGDNRFSGRRPDVTSDGDGPLRTIQQALLIARPGSRIILAKTPEPYRESISLVGLNNSGDGIRPFIIEGNGATLEGAAPVPLAAWEYAGEGVYHFRPRRMDYAQLFLDGQPLARVPGGGWDDPRPELQPLEWTLHAGRIAFLPEKDRVAADYALSHAYLPVGITCYKVRDVVIRDLIVQGYQLDGVNVHDGFRCLLSNITARGNGRAGVAVTSASRAIVWDSIIGDNGAAQLLVEGYTITDVQDTELIGNTAPPLQHTGGELTIDGQVIDGSVVPAPSAPEPSAE